MRAAPFALAQLALAVLVGGAGAGALAAEVADVAGQPDWLITADGAYVVHLSAGVAWPRCVEGMHWDGRHCSGQPRALDHAAALAWAQQRAKAEGVAWRLPQFKELQGLARQAAKPADALGAWLPGNPPGWSWSATANIDTSNVNEYEYGNVLRGVTAQNAARLKFMHAWAVDTATGEARKDMPRREALWVRLVRPLE